MNILYRRDGSKTFTKKNDNLDEQNLYKLTNRISKRQKQLAKEEPR